MSRTKRWLEELENQGVEEFLDWISKWGEDRKAPQNLNQLIVNLEIFQREALKYSQNADTFHDVIKMTFSNEVDIFKNILDKEKKWKDNEGYNQEILDFLDIKNKIYDEKINKQIDELIDFCVEEDDGYYQHFEYHFYIFMLVISGYSAKFPWLIKPGDISEKIYVKDMFWINFIKLCLRSSDLDKLKKDLARWGEPVDSTIYFVQALMNKEEKNLKKYLSGLNFYQVMLLYFMTIIEIDNLEWAFKNIYTETKARGYQTNLYADSILSFITQISIWKKNTPLFLIDGFKLPLKEDRFKWLYEQVLTVEDSFKNWGKAAIPEFKPRLLKEFAKAIDVLCPYSQEQKDVLAASIALQVN